MQVDRKTKVSATIFLKALGFTKDEIRAEFADIKAAVEASPLGMKFDEDIIERTLEYDESKVFANPILSKEEALREVYRKVRGEAAGSEVADAWLRSTYFESKRYNLARVGRHKINRKLQIEEDANITTLTKADIVSTLKYLLLFDLVLANTFLQARRTQSLQSR